MNVVKIDPLDGNIIWNYIYSMPNAHTTGWLTNGSAGLSLIEYNSGYRLVGSYTYDVTNNLNKGFMVQINKNGLLPSISSKQVYSHNYSTNTPYKQINFL